MKILTLVPILVVIGSSLVVTGCATKETQLRMTTAQTNALTCQQAVLKYKQSLADQKITFKDERNALMYLMMKELSNSKASGELEACDDIAIAQIRGQAAKTSGLINGGVRLGGLGLGVLGVSILTNGVTDLAGSSTGDTFNVSGSRVNSKSGNVTGGGTANVSSSGQGLGIANTFDGSQGGITPRNINDVTAEGVSNSGTEDAPVTLPVEP